MIHTHSSKIHNNSHTTIYASTVIHVDQVVQLRYRHFSIYIYKRFISGDQMGLGYGGRLSKKFFFPDSL